MSEEVVVAGYRFAAHKAVVICQHVFEGRKVQAFLHEEDGDLHAVCGSDEHYDEEDWNIVGLVHLIEHHPELLSVPEVPMGYVAERSSTQDEWIISKRAD